MVGRRQGDPAELQPAPRQAECGAPAGLHRQCDADVLKWWINLQEREDRQDMTQQSIRAGRGSIKEHDADSWQAGSSCWAQVQDV